MWIIKAKNQDFIVVEKLETLPKGGDYFLYFLKKQGRTTLSVIKEVIKVYKLKRGAISFAGMKDRDGITYQYIVSTVDIGDKIETNTYTLWKLYRVSSHLDRTFLQGNYFSILIRNADFIDLGKLGNGFVNYFDYQRFSVFSEGIAAKLILQRKYKQALWTLLTPGTRTKIEEYFFNEDFRECRKLANTPWERRIFDFLKRKGPRYRESLKYVDGDQRAISMIAYQSYLWNKTVSKIVEHLSSDVKYIEVLDMKLAISNKLKTNYKVPYLTWFLSEDWWDLPFVVRQAIEEVLAEEGFKELFELKTKVHGYTMILRYRDMLVRPQHVNLFSDDIGCRMIFFLPKGAYATMYIKQLAAYHGEVVQVGYGE